MSELTASIRGLLESGFGDLWVEGEISNCRLWNTGHLFFTLKDGGAQIKAVMYRSAVRYLKFKAEDGLRVVARGRLAVYEPKGEYQLLCDHLQPQGLGARQLAFEQLKKKLQGEGLFDRSRKRPLPALPAKIGIVTSLDGAALGDIIKVLTRRHPNIHLVVRPTRVQGEGAAAEIADGVRAIGRVPGVDVVIVGRGGGSAEDLWPFNQEPVARAIVGVPRAGRHGGRSRSGLHHRRFRRGRARAYAVGRRGNGDRGERGIQCTPRSADAAPPRGRRHGPRPSTDPPPRAQQPSRAGRISRSPGDARTSHRRADASVAQQHPRRADAARA